MSSGRKTEKINRLEEIVSQLEGEINDLKGHNVVLEAWRKGWIAMFDDKRGSLQSTMGALTQLWEKLRVEHQTAACMRLSELLSTERAYKNQQNTELQHRQEVSKLTEEIRVYKLALRQAESDRDRAAKGSDDHGWTVVAKDRRIEELETAIREVLAAMEAGDIRVGTNEDFDTDKLAAVLGDDHE